MLDMNMVSDFNYSDISHFHPWLQIRINDILSDYLFSRTAVFFGVYINNNNNDFYVSPTCVFIYILEV